MFATRFHTTTISLKAGETRRYRLPPMSQGGVRVRTFRVDEPDDTPRPHGPGSDPVGVDSPRHHRRVRRNRRPTSS